MNLSTEVFLLFLALLSIIAFLYASVGHGGASGYLGLMALFSIQAEILRPTALVLNIFVSAVSFWFFRRYNFFKWKLFYPFAITSIPMAFLGGTFDIDAALYKTILAVFLILAILRMLNVFGKIRTEKRPMNVFLGMIVGAVIGFLSGLIGIGGGIILSPLILILAWGDIKETAACSALFIFVNSIAGIFGHLYNGGSIPSEVNILVPIALLAGGLGAYFGSSKLKSKSLNYILALVLMAAAIKLILLQ